MSEKKHTDEMVGEALREAGGLVVVFAPLYEIFEPKPHSWIMLLCIARRRRHALNPGHSSRKVAS